MDTKEHCLARVWDVGDMVSCGEIAVDGTDLCRQHLVRTIDNTKRDIRDTEANLDSLIVSRDRLQRALDNHELPLLAIRVRG